MIASLISTRESIEELVSRVVEIRSKREWSVSEEETHRDAHRALRRITNEYLPWARLLPPGHDRFIEISVFLHKTWYKLKLVDWSGKEHDMAKLVFQGAGDVVRKLRAKRGLSLPELAVLAGTNPSLLAKFESNQSGISDARLIKLAKALEMRPDQLSFEFLMACKPVLRTMPIGKLFKKLAYPQKVSTPGNVKKPKLKAV